MNITSFYFAARSIAARRLQNRGYTFISSCIDIHIKNEQDIIINNLENKKDIINLMPVRSMRETANYIYLICMESSLLIIKRKEG